MAQIFTSHKLNAGQTFKFYSLDEILLLFDEVDVWTEKENNGLGEPIVYGRARVVRTPNNKYNVYTGLILSGENCN